MSKSNDSHYIREDHSIPSTSHCENIENQKNTLGKCISNFHATKTCPCSSIFFLYRFNNPHMSHVLSMSTPDLSHPRNPRQDCTNFSHWFFQTLLWFHLCLPGRAISSFLVAYIHVKSKKHWPMVATATSWHVGTSPVGITTHPPVDGRWTSVSSLCSFVTASGWLWSHVYRLDVHLQQQCTTKSKWLNTPTLTQFSTPNIIQISTSSLNQSISVF